eukprot:Em0622g1a
MDVLNAIGDIFYGGIQPNIPGNGGPDCVAFLSKGQLLFETLLDTALVFPVRAKTYTLPAKVAARYSRKCSSLFYRVSSLSRLCTRFLVHYIYGAAIALLFQETDSRLLTHVNLNYLLCPASVDPFRGPYYRIIGLFHQTLCLLFVGKVYTLVVKFVLYLLSSKWRKRL